MPDRSKTGPIIEDVAEPIPKNGEAQGKPAPSAEARAALRASVAELEKAGIMAGVRPDDPLAIWMRCMTAMVACGSETALDGEERIVAALAKIDALTVEERKAMTSAADRCRAEVERLDKYYEVVERRTENLVTQTITSMANKIAEEVKKRTVIVERRYNRRKLSVGVVACSALLAVVFGAGMLDMRDQDSGAVAFQKQCLAHPFTDASGAIYCALNGQPGASK